MSLGRAGPAHSRGNARRRATACGRSGRNTEEPNQAGVAVVDPGYGHKGA